MLHFVPKLISIIIVLLFALYESVYVIMNDNTSGFFKFVAVIVLVAVLFLTVHRTTYLPFLSATVLPSVFLKDTTEAPKGSISVSADIVAPDNTKVLYWASKPSASVLETPKDAYAQSTNSGVAIVKDNKATFYVECPASYKVRFMTLSPHIHYRVVLPNGLLDEVETIFVNCDKK